MSLTNPNWFALIKLLGDDHPQVAETVHAKLQELAPAVVPLLKQAADSNEDPKVRLGARAVLERIRLVEIRREWDRFSGLSDAQLNLEKGAFLLAGISYPGLDPKPYQLRLDELADRIRPALKAVIKPLDRLKVMNRALFKTEKFRGNWADYFDPENSYLHRVLERKLGIPISLSVLYLLVAQRLDLPIEGAGIPGHFMVKYKDRETEWYVDVFNEGRFLSRPECVQFIVEAGYPYQVVFLEGINSREILARMIRNLILIYMDRQEKSLEQTFTGLLKILYPVYGTEAES